MTEWYDAEKFPPPKDRNILIWGKASDIDGLSFTTPGMFLAYFDSIDGCFCANTATWLGPFIEPIYWAEEPEKPKW